MPQSNRPLFRHDCSGCEYLGTTASGRDVYQCDHFDLCIRWGSSDEENSSLPIGVVARSRQDMPVWRAALALYEKRYPQRLPS